MLFIFTFTYYSNESAAGFLLLLKVRLELQVIVLDYLGTATYLFVGGGRCEEGRVWEVVTFVVGHHQGLHQFEELRV